MASEFAFHVGLCYTLYPTIFSIPNVLLLVIFVRDREYREVSSSTILMHTCICQLTASTAFAVCGVLTLLGEEPPFYFNKVIGAVMTLCNRTFYSFTLVLAVNRFAVMLSLKRVDRILQGKSLRYLLVSCWVYGLLTFAIFMLPDFSMVYDVEKLGMKRIGSLWPGTCAVISEIFQLAVSFVLYLIILFRFRLNTEENLRTGVEIRIFVQSVIATLFPIAGIVIFCVTALTVASVTTFVIQMCSHMVVYTINPYVYLALNPTIRQKYKDLIRTMVSKMKLMTSRRITPSKSGAAGSLSGQSQNQRFPR